MIKAKAILKLSSALIYAVRILTMIANNKDLSADNIQRLAQESLDYITATVKDPRTLN